MKELMGNPGKRALPKDEPKPTEELEFMPEFIGEAPGEYWTYVVNLFRSVPGVAKAPDQAAAVLMCQAIHDFVEANAELESCGTYQTVTTKQGGEMIRLHPAAGVKKEAMSQILRICAEFGLTPAARTRLKADLGGKKKNPNDAYFN